MYNHSEIDKKWQQKWEEVKAFRALDPSETDKDPYYLLVEFPFPSGAGLHVGHPRSYTALDVVARKRRSEGFNVLYPIGWDAFGLPTENYAIKTGRPPQEVTEENVANFRRQLKSLGLSFDWDREVNTTDPEYYRWTQWMFLEFFKVGLAYKDKMAINWCPSCKIGLANEEVVSGSCERCGGPVEQREKEQWMIGITKYADRLVDDLDDVNFLEKIKKQQVDWIGRSEGAEIDFKVEGSDEKISVFTTRPDTLFGVTFAAVSPDHPILDSVVPADHKDAVEKFREEARAKQKEDAEAAIDAPEREKNGVFTGAYVINPANNGKVPLWVGDYVLMNYGTGAVMAVPAHDERDFAFAKKYDLPIKPVVAQLRVGDEDLSVTRASKSITFTEDGVLVEKWKDSDFYALPGGRWEDGEDAQTALIREVQKEVGRDVIRSRYVGVVREDVQFPDLDSIRRMEFHIFETELSDDSVDRRPKDVEKSDIVAMSFSNIRSDNTQLDRLLQQALIRHIDGTCYTGDGVLVNSGKFNEMNSEEARVAITKWLEEKGVGRAKTTYRLRDWVFSRQRYWGEPIPLVHCEGDCSPETNNWVAIPDSELPLALPVVEKYEPTDNGDSPLASVTDWVNTKCPQCGGAATRETDTMPNWAGSSWYFLRYIDPHNSGEFASKEKLDYWMPVDWYNGGMEHTTLHLLYSRFWNKFLFDRGHVPGAEPYQKRTSHGLILAEGGQKMSKSKGNVVNPDDIVTEFGADTLRVYELFIGPFSEAAPWSENGVKGAKRFLDRTMRLADFVSDSEPEEVTRSVHKTVHEVMEAIEDMRFNSAVAQLMTCVNDMTAAQAVTCESLIMFVSVLSWFAPHTANELHELIGGEGLAEYLDLPVVNKELLVEDTITIGVQVNGKLRGTIDVALDAPQGEVLKLAKADENVAKFITSEPKKEIYVPGKIVNIVV